MMPRTLCIQTQTQIRAKVHRMITVHARTDEQTDGHNGNSATIRSNERVAR